jgi:chromosome segregation ATPase
MRNIRKQLGYMMDLFEDRYKKLSSQIARAEARLSALRMEEKELFKECPHNETERKSYYVSGTYNDTAYTEYWVECKVCGLKSEKAIKNHGYYG